MAIYGRALDASGGSSNDGTERSMMNSKHNISVTSMVSAIRKFSCPIVEGRVGGFPRNDHDDIYNIFELEAELAKMRNMTAEEAAAHAAQVVSEAEAALADAEAAMREAEAAEAEALAAVAALMTMRGRNTRATRACSKKSGG